MSTTKDIIILTGAGRTYAGRRQIVGINTGRRIVGSGDTQTGKY
jgi:hypothetical protein